MSIPASRIGDLTIGDCTHDDHDDSNPWNGIIISGSGSVFTEGIGQSYISCIVLSDCGHTSVIISGSSSVFTNSLGTARIGSYHSGTYYSGTVIAGANSVFVGG